MKIFFTGLLLLFSSSIYAACSKAIIKYRDDLEKIDIYQCVFSGRYYLKLVNYNRGYCIICELNKQKAVFLLTGQTKAEGLIRYNAVTDSIGGTYRGFVDFSETTISNATSQRIYISSLEITLLKEGLKKSAREEARQYPYDLSKILFFVSAKK